MTKRIIAVRFLQSNGLSPKEYSYFTDDDSIKVGDHCVVDVVSNDYGSGLRIVQVTQTEGLSVEVRNKATKWIVQKVDMETEERAIRISNQSLRGKVSSLVNSVTTDKRLLEIWPEAAQYLPDYTPATDNLPAVTAKELNELIAVLKPVSGDPPAGSEDEVMHIQV